MATLIVATAPWLVTFPAASLMAELLKAAPSEVSMKGVYVAVKFAFAARMYVNAMQMLMPAMAPSAGEMMRERYTYSPPARGIASSRYLYANIATSQMPAPTSSGSVISAWLNSVSPALKLMKVLTTATEASAMPVAAGMPSSRTRPDD